MNIINKNDTTMRKILFLLFSVFMPLLGFADDVVIDGIYYTLIEKGKVAEVTNNPNKYSGDIVIPETVVYENTEYVVAYIGAGAFSFCKDLTSITIPHSIISIRNSAFSNCSITSIDIPNSVVTIENNAFEHCYGLTSIDIPNSVISIGDYAFSGCGLFSINIPNSVTSIGDGAFQECRNLLTIDIPNKVSTIGNQLFLGCNNLTSVTIPNSVTSIGRYAFGSCRNLTVISVPQGVRSIGDRAFYMCSSLASIAIPNGVTSFSESMFFECNSLTSINIPNSVTKINKCAFSGCSSLTTVAIGKNVNTINSQAFLNCSQLTDVYCYSENVPATSIDAFDGSFIEYATLHVPAISIDNYKSITPWKNFQDIVSAYTIVEVDGIRYKLFFQANTAEVVSSPNKYIGDINILDKVVYDNVSYDVFSIDDEAFFGCNNLVTVNIPNSVTYIGDMAFGNCGALSYVKLPYGLTSIRTGTFYGSSLEEITIPPFVKIICEYAFSSNLKTVKVLPVEPPVVLNMAFSSYENIDVKVPEVALEIYKSIEPWQNFGSINVWDEAHMLQYRLDDEIYKTYALLEGDVITPEPIEPREGYYFSGWIGLPESMPSHDVIVTGSFIANKYKLTYILDGQEYKSDEVEYGTIITPEPVPEKEGYTFSGWSEIPETMPAHDVTVNGSFTINKYKLTYMIDNQVYKTLDVEYGATITQEPVPTKEGYTFSGWSGVPERMPAHDVTVTGTFTVNKYILMYILDAKEYKTLEVDYGTAITPEPDPVKEGYTFSGWSEIPKTMPARTVIITGTFTINSYRLTYLLNGEEYKQQTVTYGAPITPEPAIEREGHSFSGWSEIPVTMPAHDVTVTGTLTVNKYVLAYILDGREYKTLELDYGTIITPEPDPEKEGYTFSGWIGLPETMPARIVIVTGTFTINSYMLTYMIDDVVYKQVQYEYGATITPEHQPEGDYRTFEWVGVPATMPAHDVIVTAVYETGIAELLMMAEQGIVRVYSPNGKLLSRPQKGLNIIVLPDGTVQKVVVK